MKWDLDFTNNNNERYQFPDIDCSLTYNEFIQIRDIELVTASTYAEIKQHWESKGLDEAKFEELRAQICPENHVRCSDSDSVFADGETSCKNSDCACVSQTKIQTQSSNIKEVKPKYDTRKILGITAVGIGTLLLIQYMRR